MIVILSCFLFILKHCAPKGVGRKKFGEKGANEIPRPRNSTKIISLPPFYQWQFRGHTGHALRAQGSTSR